MKKTKIKFLYDNINDYLFAFFYVDLNNVNRVFTTYSHGQYATCNIEYAEKCVLATPTQYKDLFIELTNLGYILEVYKEDESSIHL